jgi:hypothetical protein
MEKNPPSPPPPPTSQHMYLSVLVDSTVDKGILEGLVINSSEWKTFDSKQSFRSVQLPGDPFPGTC